MRKVCSFPGCKTGIASERKFNKMYGLRNKTLFAFPKKVNIIRMLRSNNN